MKQSSCFVSANGWDYIYRYDTLPREVRRMLRECKYNLCMECYISRVWYHCSYKEIGGGGVPMWIYMKAMNEMVESVEMMSEANNMSEDKNFIRGGRGVW